MRTPHYVQKLAKDLRQEQTEAETILWNVLRRKSLNGFKFYRQRPIGRYIVDFLCPKAKLVIEIDGEIHEQNMQREHDHLREKDLQAKGLRVLRFKNEEVTRDLETCLNKIQELLA